MSGVREDWTQYPIITIDGGRQTQLASLAPPSTPEVSFNGPYLTSFQTGTLRDRKSAYKYVIVVLSMLRKKNPIDGVEKVSLKGERTPTGYISNRGQSKQLNLTLLRVKQSPAKQSKEGKGK